MNIPQIWQKLIALVAVVTITFGMVASSASAESIKFNASADAVISVQFTKPIATGVEVGIVSQVKAVPGAPVNYLANNYAGEKNFPVGPEWKSKGQYPQNVGASTAVEIEGFSKDTPPNPNAPWKKTFLVSAPLPPDPASGFLRYNLSFISLDGSSLANATLSGLGLFYTGVGDGITIK